MHVVIETPDSSFQRHWNTLLNNDPVQDPLYKSIAQDTAEQTMLGGGFRDRSFLVMNEQQPVFGCSVTLHVDEKGRKRLGYFGLDACTHVNRESLNNTSNNFCPDSIRLLQRHIDLLLEEEQPETIDYYDPVSCGIMSPITQIFLGKGAQPTVQQVPLIDLNLSEEELLARMSSECRRNIRWGNNLLDLEVVRAGAEQHQHAPQSSTCPAEAARLSKYMELLTKGQGFLVQARCRQAIVASALFVHSNLTCQYVNADIAHTRYAGLAIEPLLQQTIFKGMLEGKRAGCQHFDFGHQHAESLAKHLPSISPESFGGDVQTRLKVKFTASNRLVTH